MRSKGIGVALGLTWALVSPSARALPSPAVISDGASRAIVEIDASGRALKRRACQGEPCVGTGAPDSIGMTAPGWLELDLATATTASIPIGEGKSVAHVVVKAKDGEHAWEALVPPSGPPLYAGPTGYVEGQEGERTGAVVRVVDGDGAKVVVVAEVREDVRLCNQKHTPLYARGLDPKTMTLRGATLQRMTPEERAGARRIVATPRAAGAEAPLARVLRAAGSSAPDAARLVDGDPATAWREERPGDGRGEFVVMRAPPEVAIDRFAVTITPPAPASTPGAAAAGPPALTAPRTFYLVVGERVHQVVLPEDGALHPGASYEIPLPEPARVGCVALVLDEAYARGPKPDVAVAELTAYTSFDHPGATVDEVVRVLAGGGARAEAAASILKRIGGPAVGPLAGAWDGLDAAGRALAIDVAASAPTCDASAPLLVKGLADRDREVERKSRGKLERCGKAAAPALTAAVRGKDAGARARAAPLLALVAPSESAQPLAEVIADGDPRTRAQVRAAFALAARSMDPKALLDLLTDPARPPEVRVGIARAAAQRLPDVAAAGDLGGPMARALAPGEPMAGRWLLLEPLATLLGKAPWAAELFAAQIGRAPEWQVRARAAEVAAGAAPVRAALVAAADDPEPRVREAAMKSLGAHPGDGAAAIERRLASDPWTFVRVAAAQALAASPPDGGVDARLVAALGDKAPKVRAEALSALGSRRVQSAGNSIEARARDGEEELEVRRAAILALGAICDARRVGWLTDVARRLASPVGPESDVVLGVAALSALAEIHPPDLAARLAPLRDKAVRAEVRRAAESALSEAGRCR